VPVLLIRHAQAGSRKAWKGDDRQRPVNAKGELQAAALVRLLEMWTPTRVLSSPYVRCVQTVEPIAVKLGLQVEPTPGLAEGAGPVGVALVREVADGTVVLCTHGDIILEILQSLAGDGLDLGPAPAQAKGSTWVLESRRHRFVNATYVRPRTR
jgi:8-oxo-dGTP diphosphatase